MIFSIIGTFQLFNEPSLMRALNPPAISVSYTPNFYAYNMPQPASTSGGRVALGLFIAIISYVVQLSTARREAKR
ncbi:MAG: hypothetical protein IPL43_00365 [Micropruina sp.]|nr:hypothetical protein [Micropruina sp.]